MRKLFLLIYFCLFLCFDQMAQSRIKDNSKDIHFTVPVNIPLSGNSTMEVKTDDSGTIYHDQAILKLPNNYSKTGKPTRLVYCAHGAGGGVTATSWFLNNYALVDSLLANGYAIFDVNGGASVENMGGPRVIQSAFQAYKYIRQHYNVEDKIFVIGLSMGGLSSTNFVYRHPNIVLAHGLFSAVLDLYGQAWMHPWLPTTRGSIASAYNFKDKSGKTWEEGKVTDWNPIFENTSVNGQDTFKIYPVPVKIWHGSGDKIVQVSCSRNFQRYIQRANGYCELREIDSDDHGLSCGSPVINHELVLFFRKYE